jgi:hypothetical protein
VIITSAITNHFSATTSLKRRAFANTSEIRHRKEYQKMYIGGGAVVLIVIIVLIVFLVRR